MSGRTWSNPPDLLKRRGAGGVARNSREGGPVSSNRPTKMAKVSSYSHTQVETTSQALRRWCERALGHPAHDQGTGIDHGRPKQADLPRILQPHAWHILFTTTAETVQEFLLVQLLANDHWCNCLPSAKKGRSNSPRQHVDVYWKTENRPTPSGPGDPSMTLPRGKGVGEGQGPGEEDHGHLHRCEGGA